MRGFRVPVVLIVLVAAVLALSATAAFGATVTVTNLQPSWSADGGGGVWGSYQGPPAYGYVSPGSVALISGRTGAPIQAGITIDPTDGIYEDQGLLAFKPGSTPVSAFATQALSWDVINQSGARPVWIYIELNKGVAGDVTYQFVPSSNPAGWHTVNAAAGSWYQWADQNGTLTGSARTLAQVASDNPGKTVDRVYITLGMGNSYHDNPAGTVAYVNNVVIGSTTYAFATSTGVATGSNVAATSSGVGVTFGTVSSSGNLAVSTVASAPAGPGGFSTAGTIYDVSTTASFGGGGFDITLPYNPASIPPGKTPRLYHFVGGTWVDITTSYDSRNYTVTGHATSFSPFGVYTSTSTTTPASSTWSLALLACAALSFIGWRAWDRARLNRA
jgi:hypothetical protein